jgi:Leucine-rich repeat (LRR) protein
MSILYRKLNRNLNEINYADDVKEIILSGREIRKIIKKIQKIIKINGLNNLQRLDLSDNWISCIKGFGNLTALQQLNLSGNRIGCIKGLSNLTALQQLDLSGNWISCIKGFSNLTALQQLNLSGNQIGCIKGFGNLTALQQLELSGNQITRIEGFDNMPALRELSLSYNQITRIEGFDNMPVLRKLDLSGNRITRIEGFDRMTALQHLDLRNNPINEVPMTIMLLRNLYIFYVDATFDQIIQRFLTKNNIKFVRTIYDDNQNVHDQHINLSITQSMYRLLEQKSVLSEEKIISEILNDPILTKRIKDQLIEYIGIPDVHSLLNVTFSEAFCVVWQIIRKHKECDEIKRILNQEMADSVFKCFTGRLSRLVNCLNGFDDRVTVRISDQQELANLIISIRQKTDSLAEQTEMVRREMTERGYDEQMIRKWLCYLE